MVNEIEECAAAEFAFFDGSVQFVDGDAFGGEGIPAMFDIAAHNVGVEFGVELDAITSFGEANGVVVIEIVAGEDSCARW